MNASRRTFLRSAAAASATTAFALTVPGAFAASRFANPLRIPPLIEPIERAGGKTFDLAVARAESRFLPGVSTPTFGINGSYLGPTIRVHSGDRIALRVKNQLGEPTTLHWHGLLIPALYDGGPHQVVANGAVWEPSFDVKQNASLCWYHSHLMGRTGQQVLRGLAGLFLIDDDETDALRLPSEYGVDDIPLIIQDRRFNRDGSFDYLSTMHDTMAGYRGDVILVNGTYDPYLTLRRQLTRLRILNASNARTYMFGRDDGKELVVIGGDGGLLDRPVRQRRVRLGVGERVELLLQVSEGERFRLMSYPDDTTIRRMGPGMMGGGMMARTAETLALIELRADRLEASAAPHPSRLIRLPSWTETQAARTRTFTLEMGMMGMMGGMGTGSRRSAMSGFMGINGRSMDMARIDVRVPFGSVEIWVIDNASPFAHPFHIHGVQFRILDRDGQAPSPHESGLKDTVMVDPGSTVRVITRFAEFADPHHPYMYHCHILEHEDAGMMGQFVVM